MFRRLLVLIIIIMSATVGQLQAQQLNYQAVARNANGVALTFKEVNLKLSIRDGSAQGTIVYSETRLVRTNQFGMMNVVIGSLGASNIVGSMAAVNWISGNKFLQVEIDPDGGANFFQAGTSQLQSVPYALFANAAYPVGPAGGDLRGSTYPNPIIAPLAVNSIKLGDTAVTTQKIADSAVTTRKIMDSAVTTAKLFNKSVSTEKVEDSAITNNKIKNGAITNEKITDGTIQNIKLVNSSITLNGLVLNLGSSQSFIVDSTGNDVNIVSANAIHRFNFPNASIANRGLITTNTQTIGGNKIFNNDITAARIIRSGGIAAQFLKADGSVDNNIYLTANQPIIVTATGDATGISTSSGTAPVLPLTLATVNSTVGTYGTNIEIPSIAVNNKGLVTNVTAIPIPTATATALGLLTAANWNTFNNKQNAIPLGTTAQYFRGDLSLSNFQTDVRAQLSAGTNISYANGQFGVTNNSVTINTLPLTLGSSQTFATGTGGIDFNISSLGTVHTFNIPSASTFARGLLTNTDFTNFNAAYTNRISSLTTTGTSGVATLSANVLNIPNYTYTLPAATSTILGGVQSGANITNTSGTISITSTNVINALGSQSANRFLVAPDGAGGGLPTFRVMATGDIPDNIVTNTKLFGGITNDKLETIILAGKVANSATTATDFNTPSTIVQRNASGNFNAGIITASLNGNVSGTAANVTGIVLGANGGTGIANTGKTITLGGNLLTVGAFATTLTSTAATSVTLPTTGTLATLTGTETITGAKTFGAAGNVSKLILAGSTSGSTILDASAVATGTVILPAAGGTLATLAGTETLTNKTLTSPTLTTPALGTPASGIATHLTGTATALNIGGNAATATSATTATNLAAGLGGQIPYQSAAGTTAMLANGTVGQVLQSNGTTLAPTWVTATATNTNSTIVLRDASGNFSAGSISATKIIGNSSTPTLLHATTAIDNATPPTIVGNDMAGYITFTTGPNPPTTTGDFITIMYATPYINPPVVIIQPVNNGTTKGLATSIYCLPGVLAGSGALTEFKISTGAFLATSTEYRIAYHVIGR